MELQLKNISETDMQQVSELITSAFQKMKELHGKPYR